MINFGKVSWKFVQWFMKYFANGPEKRTLPCWHPQKHCCSALSLRWWAITVVVQVMKSVAMTVSLRNKIQLNLTRLMEWDHKRLCNLCINSMMSPSEKNIQNTSMNTKNHTQDICSGQKIHWGFYFPSSSFYFIFKLCSIYARMSTQHGRTASCRWIIKSKCSSSKKPHLPAEVHFSERKVNF